LQDKLPELKADYILMNPPFNVSQWHPEDLPENDPRIFKIKDSNDPVVTDGNANYMWFQSVWNHLSNNGTAGIVMANGAMTSNNKGERNVREHMLNEGMIDCIVRLPDKLFLTTGIPACIFYLSKTRKGNKDHRERKNEVLFIDANKMGEMLSRKLRVLTDAETEKIAEVYHNWRNIKGKYNDVQAFCKAATLEEIIKQDYKLTPGIYVGSEDAEIDDVPFEVRMDALKTTLKEQFAKSNELQKRIEKNLQSIK
jgi:type I restriction enzyme M protein